ncbi:MAG: hypothetical protein ACI8XC_002648 [Gammaproteobacteria bacterium]
MIPLFLIISLVPGSKPANLKTYLIDLDQYRNQRVRLIYSYALYYPLPTNSARRMKLLFVLPMSLLAACNGHINHGPSVIGGNNVGFVSNGERIYFTGRSQAGMPIDAIGMYRRLPLAALRTFEVAARLQSFKLAAQELSVTPTTVSNQIRNLERDWGCQLFIRKTRQLVLTDVGARCPRP